MDTSYVEISRKFGSEENMQNITDSTPEDQLDLSSDNIINSDEFYIPAISREATKLEEVFNIDTILTPEQFAKIYSEIEGTEFTLKLNPFLKSIATETLSQKHTVLLVYADTLLQLYKTLIKDISKESFTACQYSVTLNEIVMNNFLCIINGKRGRSPQYKDKALCHALVFILLINSYKFNIDDLCQQLKLPLQKVTSQVAFTGATVVNVGSKKVAQLKLELLDNVKSKTVNCKESLSKNKVNGNTKNVNITRKIKNKNTYYMFNNVNKEEFEQCNDKFTNYNDIKKHSLSHSGLTTQEKPYKCDVCQRSFSQSSDLKIHIRIHTGENPFQCDICDRSYKKSGNLKRHVLIHDDEKRYQCDICQRSFKKSSNLKRHDLIHSGEKRYQCDICQRSFIQAGHLKRHILIHTGERPHKCDICQRSFNHTYSLKRHILIHNGKNLDNEISIRDNLLSLTQILRRDL